MLEQILNEQMLKASKVLGIELLDVPVKIQEKGPSVAWTTVDSINIRKDVLETAPEDIPMLLAHEIGHHVVGDREATEGFHHNIVNVAEDYKINWLIYKHWGYDVRTAKNKSELFSEDLGPKPLRQICEEINKTETHFNCGCMGLKNPTLIKLANKIKRKFGMSVDHIYALDQVDENEFLSIPDQERNMVKSFKRLNINLESVSFALWAKLVLKDCKANPSSEVMTKEQAIVFAINDSLFRSETQNSNAYAMMAIFCYLYNIDNDAEYIENKKMVLEHRINRTTDELLILKGKASEVATPMKPRTLDRKIKRLTEIDKTIKDKLIKDKEVYLNKIKRHLAYFQKLRPVTDLLNEELPKLQGKTEKAFTPKWKTSYLMNRLKNISYRAYNEFEDLADILKELEDRTGSDFEEMLSDPEGEETNETQELNEGDPETGGSEEIEFKGPRKEKRSKSTIQEIYEAREDLARMIDIMKGFDKALNTKRANKETDRHSTEKKMTLGNDLDMILMSEYALLANPETELDFLMRFANGTLLQMSNFETKANSVIINVDVSGSTSSKPWIRNVLFGLALSLMALLRKSRTPMAIQAYDAEIRYKQVFHKDQKINFRDFLRVLSYKTINGGTNGDVALNASYDIRDENNWTKTLVIVGTDGHDRFSDRAFDRKSTSTILGVTTSAYSSLRQFDQVVKINSQGEISDLSKAIKDLI